MFLCATQRVDGRALSERPLDTAPERTGPTRGERENVVSRFWNRFLRVARDVGGVWSDRQWRESALFPWDIVRQYRANECLR